MKVINMKYNPITGVIYTFIEVPDYKIIPGHNTTAAMTAYTKSQLIRERRNARIRKNNTKHK